MGGSCVRHDDGNRGSDDDGDDDGGGVVVVVVVVVVVAVAMKKQQVMMMKIHTDLREPRTENGGTKKGKTHSRAFCSTTVACACVYGG